MAELTERSKRRHAQYVEAGKDHELRAVYDALAARDFDDAFRIESPLIKAPDAVVINTTYINIEQMVALGIKHVSGVYA